MVVCFLSFVFYVVLKKSCNIICNLTNFIYK
ncbi:hypothetical protein GLYMA_15G155450v4 [Glycine max]|nr:hypothetical protein GLYMA_15G155450v4 [Glycine max]KAH1147336.1 hypothetical protein GYH30_042478 [Glycine max]